MAQICRNSLSSDKSHFVKQHADSSMTFFLTTYANLHYWRVVRLYSNENEFCSYIGHSVNSSIVNC